VIEILLVSLGAAVGAPLRFWLDQRLPRHVIPWGVLIANVVGSFALGVVSGHTESTAYLLFGTGFAGSLTTMSGLAIDSIGLVRTMPRWGVLNVVATLALGVAAAALGVALG
jgi:CrcB protein